jgi:thiol-disulfide isomerase/thioredoxin
VINLLVAVGIIVVVSGVAIVSRRRGQSDVPTQKEWHVPVQIDIADFDEKVLTSRSPDSERWFVVVFTSATCHVCRDVADKAQAVASRFVTVRECEYSTDRPLHEKYRIDAVPTLLIADSYGVVQRHFLGPVSATDLWAAVAEAREPDRPGIGGDCSSR